MTEYRLETDGRTDVGNGYSLETTRLQGTVRELDSATGARAFETNIDRALEQAGLRLDKVLVLPLPAATRARDLGGEAEDSTPTATLNVPITEDETCVLLVEDAATGALSWVLPENLRDLGKGAKARKFVTSLRFAIPLDSVGLVEGTRGLAAGAAALGKKIKAFFFKVTDELLGPVIHGFASKWEKKHRPAFSRSYGPSDYRIDDPKFPRLDLDGWQRMAQGRALMFVHGTFSTCGAFGALDPSVMDELSRRYEGRVFAFNHPTLSEDPRENAIAFLSDIPDGVRLQVDIVCHSRGGLVARQIAALGAIEQLVDVRRIIFVGATNAGTALADPEHMIEMVDRFTTLASFIPQGVARRVVDALVLVVKVLGHGLLSELQGLSAMSPSGTFLKALNVPGATGPEYFAIASNFEPRSGTPFVSLRWIEDSAADRVFEHAANDLVVPLDGVFAKNGAFGFPIGDGRCWRFAPSDGVVHTEFFSESRTGELLLEWLQPDAPAAREIVARSADELARVLDVFRNQALAMLTSNGGARAVREARPTLTPRDFEALRAHVVNLSGGTFEARGRFLTSPADVDAIVREHMPRWAETRPAGEPLRVVIWAHGGLVGEADGLQIAKKHIDWWKRNGVYPIYFVWETGLFDALRSILEAVARRIPGLATRDLFDYTTDPLVQEGVRALGGVHVWGAMKKNAELCSDANGGARYVARQLKELADNAALRSHRELQLHAVGHSAGSIFHAWFLPMATAEIGVPNFSSLQLLAPAITIADFSAKLAQHLGPGRAVEKAVMYTMKKSYEEDDSCIGVYRKSLLYLIHHALEPERRTPILGLDLSVRAHGPTAQLFGLHGAANAPGRIVWSVTETTEGRGSSRSETHGGFDDDAPTLNSVAANVLDLERAPVPYVSPSNASRARDWPIADDWLDGVDTSAVGAGLTLTAGDGANVAAAAVTKPKVGSMLPQAQVTAKPLRVSTSRGSRRALCVGIDEYGGENSLVGCVNDTKLWHQALTTVGFDVQPPLWNDAATHEEILIRLRELVRPAKRGDVLVFHYSGHGVSLPDTDGDEDDGIEEALVPFDYKEGGFLLDDDVRAVLDELAEGVSFTAFIDCCHSGTITRVFGRNGDDAEEPGTRSRYLKRTGGWSEWERAYVRLRQRVKTTRQTRAFVGAESLRWVNFSACAPSEKALESNGNGHFTRIATRLIERGLDGFTHRSFQEALLQEFGEQRRQTPHLDCADHWRDLPLLQSLL